VQVGRLRCLRGIDTLTAVGLCAEIGDFERFAKAPQLMDYVGLVPCESTTGQQRRLGAITKTGSGHARRLLVEAAWHYRKRPAIGTTLANRQDGQPAEAGRRWPASSATRTTSAPRAPASSGRCGAVRRQRQVGLARERANQRGPPSAWTGEPRPSATAGGWTRRAAADRRRSQHGASAVRNGGSTRLTRHVGALVGHACIRAQVFAE
jgi:hypothetical protein